MSSVLQDYDTPERVWFTADHHFGHKNIIKYCTRPFQSASEMDDYLVAAWNRTIDMDDLVFHLGDFTLGDSAARYFSRLNGRIHILEVPWHHDKRWISKKALPIFARHWEVRFLPPIHVIYINGLTGRPLPITMSHYPMAEWEASYHGAWHLHGHSHGSYDPGDRYSMDVGVDCHYYFPVSLKEVIQAMKDKGWRGQKGELKDE